MTEFDLVVNDIIGVMLVFCMTLFIAMIAVLIWLMIKEELK